MSRLPTTPAEQAMFDAGYNEAVKTIADLASRTAAAIEKTSKRPLQESFSVVALRELAESAMTLLVASPARSAGAAR